jgi:integrase
VLAKCLVVLLESCSIRPDDKKSKVKVSIPQAQDLADDYPDNKTIQQILNATSPAMRGFVMTLNDTGFEPIDASNLRVKDFDEDPVRIAKNREKTGHKLEGFISKQTTDMINQIIKLKDKKPDAYIFLDHYGRYGTRILRTRVQ